MPGQKMLDELNDLHHEFLDLVTCVEEAVGRAAEAVQEPNSNAVTAVGDGPVERAKAIVWRCQRIVLLYQPVAGDFRDVTEILRRASELESLGALAARTAERARGLAAWPEPVPEELAWMCGVVVQMVRSALRDAVPTCRMARNRAKLTGLARALTERLIGAMRENPALVQPGLDLFVVIQNLQHIADHAINLAEELAVPIKMPSAGIRASGADRSPQEPPHVGYGS